MLYCKAKLKNHDFRKKLSENRRRTPLTTVHSIVTVKVNDFWRNVHKNGRAIMWPCRSAQMLVNLPDLLLCLLKIDSTQCVPLLLLSHSSFLKIATIPSISDYEFVRFTSSPPQPGGSWPCHLQTGCRRSVSLGPSRQRSFGPLQSPFERPRS